MKTDLNRLMIAKNRLEIFLNNDGWNSGNIIIRMVEVISFVMTTTMSVYWRNLIAS